MNVVAYCRVSTNKADQINSFLAQQEFFKEYTQKMGMSLIRIYADEGITGTSTKNRTEFNRMMEDSKSGQFSCVLVKDVSRLARNTVDFLQSIRALRARNINIKFITGNMETMDGSEIYLTMLAAIAQEESANTSKRVKFGKAQNALKGKVPNQCYGYIKTIGDYFHLQINETEAEIVREIFDLYAIRGEGTHKIAKRLNARGLTSARGVPWSTTAVSRLLKNKIYAGYVINGKSEITDFIEKTRRQKDESEWIEVERPELRIIPLELWEKAQSVNAVNNLGLEKTVHKKRSNCHLFSTLITCPDCGHSFRRFKTERKNYTKIWWACSGRNHHGTKFCNNLTTITESELIENLDRYLLSLITDRDKFIHDMMAQYERHQPAVPGKVLADQLAKLETKRKKQIELFEADIIGIAELKEKTADIDKQIAQIKLELGNYDSPEETERKCKRLYQEFREHFSEFTSVANLTNAEMKTLIRSIIADSEGNIHIELNL